MFPVSFFKYYSQSLFRFARETTRNLREKIFMQNQDPLANRPPASISGMSPVPIPNAVPPQYNYPSYPQYPQYPPVIRSTSKEVARYGLIGGAIAGGIDMLYFLVTTALIVRYGFSPLYQILPIFLLASPIAFHTIEGLIIALLSAPGFFVTGLLATRKAGRISSAISTWTLSLACFAVVDLCVGIVLLFYFTTITITSTFNTATGITTTTVTHAPISFPPVISWIDFFVGWLINLIIVSMVSFGVATIGGAIGEKKRQ
jgi:hypothetical protein